MEVKRLGAEEPTEQDRMASLGAAVKLKSPRGPLALIERPLSLKHGAILQETHLNVKEASTDPVTSQGNPG
ncbi:hypothetical protein SRHO_G00163520 [Serrasalmus rhombeus]